MLDSVKAALSWFWTRWKKVGHAITRTINFILLILAYFLAIGPTALLLRLTGSDVIDKEWRPDKERDTYWLPRPPVSQNPDDYTRQF